ncbi:glutathione S-transferase family protein [Novosphingobium sp. AP12]|uniref:glutathione S-transferase family protein n=1 Tax=Novosphingobium sp. AP12 TaxID=1144305 RepID=UPI0012F92B88|nr:glutathione S-transferase family protein [Novosphingobium sp. AP12]
MKLYWSPWTHSLGPQILAYEAGTHITVIQVDPDTGNAEDGRVLEDIDPFGVLPLLEVVEGATLREPGAILQAMIALAPSEFYTPPSDTIDAFRLAQWLEFGAGRLASAIQEAADHTHNRSDAMHTSLARCVGWMDVQLGMRPYLMSGGYSVADIHVWAHLYRGLSVDASGDGHRSVRFGHHSNVQRWYDALGGRPAFQAVLAGESRISQAVVRLAAAR